MDTPTRTAVADAGLPSRLAGGFLRWQLTRPAWIVILAVVAVAVVGAVFLGVATRDATLLVLAGIWVIAVALILLVSHAQTRRSVRAAHPAGSTASVSLMPEHLRVTSVLGTTELRYAAIRRVFATPTVIVLRTANSPVGVVLPPELLTDADVALLRARIAEFGGAVTKEGRREPAS